MNSMRWMTLWTLAIVIGSATVAAVGEPGRDDGFGPDDDRGGHAMMGDKPEDRGDHHDRRDRFRMSDEDAQAAYGIIVELYPELAERLETLREDEPQEFKKTIERKFPRVRFLVGLKKHDPAMYDLRIADIRLDRQTDALAKQLHEAREADDKQRYNDLRDAIEDKVAEHFNVRQQIRAREIEMLKAKIETLEERLDDRDDDRRDLIEQRVNELVGPDW